MVLFGIVLFGSGVDIGDCVVGEEWVFCNILLHWIVCKDQRTRSCWNNHVPYSLSNNRHILYRFGMVYLFIIPRGILRISN